MNASKRVRFLSLLFVCAAIFALVTNCWNHDLGRSWQADSEDLVWGRILMMQLGEDNGGFMGKYKPITSNGYLRECFREGGVPQGEKTTYTHQSGLQATVFGMINLVLQNILPPKVIWAILRAGNSVMFIALMFLLCRWIWKKVGMTAALAAASCLLLMEYSLKAMPNLYWVIWTMLLPCVASTAVCEWLERDKCGKRMLLGAVLIGLPTLLRCLCGFEFVSAVMVGAELPIVWKFLESPGEKKRFWFKFAVFTAVFQFVAFALAFGIWIIQDALHFQSWDKVKEDILATISKRTGAFSEWVPDNEAYIASLEVSRMTVLQLYLEAKIYLEAFSILDLVKCAVISFVPLAICGVWKKKTDPELVRQKLTRQGLWFLFSLISIAGPASWYVLASGHSWIHTHINGVLWLLPTAPLLMAAIAGNIAAAISLLKKKKENGTVK